MLVRPLGESDLPGLVELHAGQQSPCALRGPYIEQRPLERHRSERDSFTRRVPHVPALEPPAVEIGRRRGDEVARTEIRRDLDGPGTLADQVERADQLVQRRSSPADLESPVHLQRHRTIRLVGIGVDGDPVPARHGNLVPLGLAVQGVGGPSLNEGDIRVVQLLDDPHPQCRAVGDSKEIPRLCVVDRVPLARRPRPQREGQVQCPVSRVEIAPHVDRRDPLPGRHDIETTGVGLPRKQLAQLLDEGLVQPQQILNGVLVFELG